MGKAGRLQPCPPNITIEKVNGSDKHSTLLQFGYNYNRKIFIRQAPGVLSLMYTGDFFPKCQRLRHLQTFSSTYHGYIKAGNPY
jgi:hypothetical protein